MAHEEVQRVTIRLPKKLLARVDGFAQSNSISRTQAIIELLGIGIDGEIAGLESALEIQASLKRELNAIRGLVVSAIDSGDTASATALLVGVKAGDIDVSEVADIYGHSRRFGKENIKRMKSNA